MKRIFIITSIVLILLPGLLFSYFFLAFNGGLWGVLSSLKHEPDWDNGKIVQARNETKEDINIVLNHIQTEMNFNIRGSDFSDQCVKGDHDWMENDPYAYLCTYKINNYYSFNTDFRKRMLDLESVLIQNGWHGWQKNDKPISEMIHEYYDDTKNTNYGRTGLVSSLPSVTFYNDDGIGNLETLKIDYAQNETLNLDTELMIPDFSYGAVYNQKSSVDLSKLFDTDSNIDKYFLIISMDKTYFEN